MGTIPTYDIGDKIRIGNHTGTNEDGVAREPFTDVLGTIADPTTVTLRIRKLPDGTPKIYGWPTPGTEGTLTREMIARFYFDVIFVAGDAGDWAWRLEGTGIVHTADVGQFKIVPSLF